VALAPSYTRSSPRDLALQDVMPRVRRALRDVMRCPRSSRWAPRHLSGPIYAGTLYPDAEVEDARRSCTVRTSTLARGRGGRQRGRSRTPPLAADPGLSSFVGEEVARGDRPELTSAKMHRSGGRAMQSLRISQKTRAIATSSARASLLARRRSMPAMRRTTGRSGKTGKVVAPALVAVGISARSSISRMKDYKVIVTINKERTRDLPGCRLRLWLRISTSSSGA